MHAFTYMASSETDVTMYCVGELAHVPITQLWPLRHATPHRPQFVVEPRLASQPFAGFMSQSAKPGMQSKVHASSIPQRAIVAFAGAVQGSLRVPRPSALQIVRVASPVGHVAEPGMHTSRWHVLP